MLKKVVIAVVALLALVAGVVFAQNAGAATVKAETRVSSFNAAPEPVAVGDPLTVSGTLERKSTTWLPMANTSVLLQFKPAGGKYGPFKTVTTNGLGEFSYSVAVKSAGTYRAVYAGSTKYAPFTGVGDSVAVAQTKVTVKTKVSNWPDTDAANGIWAHDNFVRTLVVTRGAKVTGGYSYNFAVLDEGGFVSGKNVPSPNAPAVNLHGVVRGSFDGGISGSFVSASRYLVAANVPAVEDATDGKVATSSQWASLALPDSATVESWGASIYSWVYENAGTCETFTQATEGNVGNILGINVCE